MTRRSSRGWSRRAMLQGTAGLLAGLAGLSRRARAAGDDRLLLVWWNAGGWDPTFVFDPHWGSEVIANDPDSTPASAGDLAWASAPSRPAIDALFTTWGSQAVVINGLSVGSISHEACTRMLLTGQRLTTRPDVAAVVAAELGSDLPLPYLNLGGPNQLGDLGHVMTPVFPETGGVLEGTQPTTARGGADREALISQYLADVGASLDTPGPRLQTWRDALARVEALKPQASLLRLPADPSDADRVDVAVAALRAGLSRTVVVDAPLANQVAWDSHIDNAPNQIGAFESSFSALNSLLATLEAEVDGDGVSLLDRTTIVVASEMGRTPVENAMRGKDHWPTTSMLVLGAGVAGGRVLGATNASLVGEAIDLRTGATDASGERLTPAHVMAGLLEDFGVDPEPWLPGVTPFTAPWSSGAG